MSAAYPEVLSPADLLAMVKPSDRYTVLAANQTHQEEQYGQVFDIVEFTFMVTGRPGVFTAVVPLAGEAAYAFGIDLTGDVDTIGALYRL